jgi:hypothetical protein
MGLILNYGFPIIKGIVQKSLGISNIRSFDTEPPFQFQIIDFLLIVKHGFYEIIVLTM